MEDRFASMRSKGINTYDADATAEDILEGKTAYVAGQKITGTNQGGGGISVGTTVTVQAMNGIQAGDRVKLTDPTNPTLLTKTYVADNMACISEDLSVGLVSEALSTGATEVHIGFLGEGSNTYDIITVPIPSTAIRESSVATSRCCTINEDGTLIIIGRLQTNTSDSYSFNGIIAISVDKTLRSATAQYFEVPFENQLGSYNGQIIQMYGEGYQNNTNFFLTKNYLVSGNRVKYGSSNNFQNWFTIHYFDGNSFTLVNTPYEDYVRYCTKRLVDMQSAAWYNDTTLLICHSQNNNSNWNSGGKVYVNHILEKIVFSSATSINQTSITFNNDYYYGIAKISKNARYISYGRFYR